MSSVVLSRCGDRSVDVGSVVPYGVAASITGAQQALSARSRAYAYADSAEHREGIAALAPAAARLNKQALRALQSPLPAAVVDASTYAYA
ncbi:MAG: hypothetical protein EON92_16280, partial [Burkholderiales bacterium]